MQTLHPLSIGMRGPRETGAPVVVWGGREAVWGRGEGACRGVGPRRGMGRGERGPIAAVSRADRP